MDLRKLPIMEAYCKTCPFKPIGNGVQNQELVNKVVERTLFKGQQICHGTEGRKRREWKNRCKGAWEHNSAIYIRMGMEDLVNKLKGP